VKSVFSRKIQELFTSNYTVNGYTLKITELIDYHPARTFPRRIYVTVCRLFLLGLLNLEGGTDTLSPNVGKQLPQDAA
jgi:hypothetical protein